MIAPINAQDRPHFGESRFFDAHSRWLLFRLIGRVRVRCIGLANNHGFAKPLKRGLANPKLR